MRPSFKKGDNNYDYIKFKFGRDPKVRTICEIHSLYLKTKKRYNDRRKNVWNYVEKMWDELPHNIGYGGREECIIYHSKGENDHPFSKSRIYKGDKGGLVISSGGIVGEYEKTDISLHREESIDIINNGEKKIKMTKIYDKLSDLSYKSGYLLGITQKYLFEIVREYLTNYYKGKYPPKIFQIEICNIKYYVSSDYSHGFNSFEILNKVIDNTIKIHDNI